MARYSVGGRSVATAATANHCAAQLWNPHATKAIKVVGIRISKTAATIDNHTMRRTTARGTPGSTVTPDVTNHLQRQYAPGSGAVLDLAAFTVQPTLEGIELTRDNLPATIGSGFVWSFLDSPLEVGPGKGLAVCTPVAVILQPSDFTFIWDE